MKEPLKDRLLRYLKNNPRWHPKGELAELAHQATGQLSETVGRRLRDLEGEGKVEVKQVKGHSHYRIKLSTSTPEKAMEDYWNSI